MSAAMIMTLPKDQIDTSALPSKMKTAKSSLSNNNDHNYHQHVLVSISRTNSSSSVHSSSNKTSTSLKPITAHYKLNSTLHKSFYQLYNSFQFYNALHVGIQFCRMALYDIPQHSYYFSPKYTQYRVENAKDAVNIADLTVLDLIPKIKSLGSYDDVDEGDTLTEAIIVESELLREVAHVNLQYIVSTLDMVDGSLIFTECNKTDIPTQPNNHQGDEYSSSNPSWFQNNITNILNCGETMSLNLCPITFPTYLSSIHEETVESHDENTLNNNNNLQNQLKNAMERLHTYYENKRLQSPTSINIEQKHSFTSSTTGTSTSFSNQNKDESTFDDSVFKRSLYLSGVNFPNTETVLNNTTSVSSTPTTDIAMSTNEQMMVSSVSSYYRSEFWNYYHDEKICVVYLNTYQGRIRESCNGCSVIAPLLAIQYLAYDSARVNTLVNLEELPCKEERNKRQIQNEAIDMHPNNHSGDSVEISGLPEQNISTVIDIEAPLVLAKVRAYLGLPEFALIVPSDVHDHLIQENLLCQSQFMNVYGGNIMDDTHLDQFLNGLLEVKKDAITNSNRKIAATFFFHGHVICIHRLSSLPSVVSDVTRNNEDELIQKKKKLLKKFKLKRSKSKGLIEVVEDSDKRFCFDLIDSLPNALMFPVEDIPQGQDREMDEAGWLSNTVRIRCDNIASLKICLRWYACSKFTKEDDVYINTYSWDDMNADFDPRVFQAFLWCEKSN